MDPEKLENEAQHKSSARSKNSPKKGKGYVSDEDLTVLRP